MRSISTPSGGCGGVCDRPLRRDRAAEAIDGVDWFTLTRPRLHDARRCDAIVADFSADLPDEWEAFLADAALAGRIVYQVKQLSESLTGRVEIEHLSENSFGSLLPARGYFHLKGLGDFLFAVAVLPLALPVMAACAVAIRLESKGPLLFRQKRVGHAGKRIIVYKFRTMPRSAGRRGRPRALRSPATTTTGSPASAASLRNLRLDELPQIFNILKWRDELDRPAARGGGAVGLVHQRDPLLPLPPRGEAGHLGLGQVNQGHVAEVDEVHRKLQYDFYYIKYFSPWLDLLILLRTIKTMLTGWGAR